MNSLSEIYSTLHSESILDVNNIDYKNCDKGTCHSYIDFYEQLFSHLKEQPVNVLEIGIYGGISILLWERYFKNSEKIVGVDIDLTWVQDKVVNESKTNKKIQLIQQDASVPSLLDVLDSNDTYDIIIDDGSHWVGHQLATFNILKSRMKVGGIYIIEDIQNDSEASYLKNSIPNSEIIDLRGIKNRYDDLVLVYKK